MSERQRRELAETRKASGASASDEAVTRGRTTGRSLTARCTRRRFLAASTVILAGTAGCADEDIEQMELTMMNFLGHDRTISIRLETFDEEIVLDRRFELGGERLERVEIPERRLRTVHVEADGFSESVRYDPPRQCRRDLQQTLLVAVDDDEVYLTYGCESPS